jgi:small GTP-binding protein
MGGWLTKLYRVVTFNTPVNIIMLGLDAAGKTTMLYKMKLGEVITSIPTIGFNVEEVHYKNLNLTTWDVGGRSGVRPLYRHWYKDAHALIYVVDSNARDRTEETSTELDKVLKDTSPTIPMLIFANKMDLPDSMSLSEVRICCHIAESSHTVLQLWATEATWISIESFIIFYL